MHEGLKAMLDRYGCRSTEDYRNALREIVQQIALLGLWRQKFYEHAAFYGGSALRIVHGQDRFSEDLGFSLLRPNPRFDLTKYVAAAATELRSFGFEITIENRPRSFETPIRSAFLKSNTRMNLIAVETPALVVDKLHGEETLKVKIEVDIDPPAGFRTEATSQLLPIPHSILCYSLPDLFAGKLSAVLCRKWEGHVKGRDWHDIVWFIGRTVPVRLEHLARRLVQNSSWSQREPLTRDALQSLLRTRIDETDFGSAREDVRRFIADQAVLKLWSVSFFQEVASRITTT